MHGYRDGVGFREAVSLSLRSADEVAGTDETIVAKSPTVGPKHLQLSFFNDGSRVPDFYARNLHIYLS